MGFAETFPMGNWTPPVHFSGLPAIQGRVLALEDKHDQIIKAYDISEGLARPEFLWSAGERGLGPGEIPKGSRINNIAIEPQKGSIWVSHQNGVTVFDKTGKLVVYLKDHGNQSWIDVNGPHILMSARNPLFDRGAALKLVERGRPEPIWELPFPRGLPVVAEGRILLPSLEARRHNDAFFFLNSTTGELLRVDKDGALVWVVYLKSSLPQDQYGPESFTMLEMGERLRTRSLFFPFSGMGFDNGELYVLSHQTARGIVRHEGEEYPAGSGERRYFKLVNRVDQQTGEVVARFFHPLLTKHLYLIAIIDGDFLAIDQEDADALFRIPFSELIQVSEIYF